jgi:hypothetical protein
MKLKDQVLSIIKSIESGIDLDGEQIDVCDYMSDALDINYITNSDKSYKGARILVAFGGPNIWIDTSIKQVEGYWWNENFSSSFIDEIGIDEFCEELFNCQ